MEPEDLLLCSEEAPTSHYFEVDEAIPRPHPISYNDNDNNNNNNNNNQFQGIGLQACSGVIVCSTSSSVLERIKVYVNTFWKKEVL
jgi:hypothetical protein